MVKKIKLVIVASTVFSLSNAVATGFEMVGSVALNSAANTSVTLSVDDIDSMDSGYPNMDFLSSAESSVFKQKEIQTVRRINDDETLISKLQIILDRAGVSPGVINGQRSEYLVHALKAYSEKIDRNVSLQDINSVKLLISEAKEELFSYYEITAEDVAGPFVEKIPKRIQDQGMLEALEYSSIEEKLAEHFHMDEEFLLRLNPNVDLKKSGSKIRVANVGRDLSTRVVSIKADMQSRWLSAFDKNGEIVAIYPASIGSPQNPSPRGTFKVRNKAGFPKYTLSPSNTFEPIDDGLSVVVASGPNNPVGIAWIGLSKKSYGIHGTPWPSRVGEAGSHGCIRLTNWDAMELATLVSTGVEVVID